jgi:hypothetical protein
LIRPALGSVLGDGGKPLCRAGTKEEEMKELTRRGFLTRTSVGMAIAGAAAVVPGLGAVINKRDAAAPDAVPAGAEPLVVHVRDFATGELSLMSGMEQKVVRDHDLAVRLYGLSR